MSMIQFLHSGTSDNDVSMPSFSSSSYFFEKLDSHYWPVLLHHSQLNLIQLFESVVN
jgi:hypothetical protein